MSQAELNKVLADIDALTLEIKRSQIGATTPKQRSDLVSDEQHQKLVALIQRRNELETQLQEKN